MELAVILLMLFLSAFFSGSEIAFVSANRLRAEMHAHRGDRSGRLVRQFLNDPSTILTTTLVGNNVALVIYSTLMAFYLEPAFTFVYAEWLGVRAGVEVLVLGSQTIVASAVVLLFGEIIPKTIMREHADRLVLLLAIPLRITYYLLLPIVVVAGWASNHLVRILRADAVTLTQYLRQDFELLIQETTASGELDLDEEESTLLSNVFTLGTLRVKESMVPRTEIEGLLATASVEEARRRFVDTGFSRIPVFEDNIDHIIGIVFAHDLFQNPTSLEEMIRPVRFVPEAKLSKKLLREFLASGTSIAIAVDEYGGTAGLITREDLLEELFGDIQDEFDVDEEDIQQVRPGIYLVDAAISLDDFAEATGVRLESGAYETLGGYLLERTGRIPKPQETFTYDGCQFTIQRATARRIEVVRVIVEDVS